MGLWARIRHILRDQRGQLDLDPEIGSFLSGPIGSDVGGGGGFSLDSLPSFSDIASGIGGGLRSFADIAKGIMPVAQLGLGGLSAYNQIRGGQQLGTATKAATQAAQTQADLAKTAKETAAPVSQFSQEQLAAAAQGKIPAPIQAQIDLWRQGAKQQVMDYAARAGIGDSSTVTSWLAWIDQQAEAMAAQALQGEQGLGVQAAGTAGGILGAGAGAAGGAASTATGQQQSMQALLASANEVLGKLTGGAA